MEGSERLRKVAVEGKDVVERRERFRVGSRAWGVGSGAEYAGRTVRCFGGETVKQRGVKEERGQISTAGYDPLT